MGGRDEEAIESIPRSSGTTTTTTSTTTPLPEQYLYMMLRDAIVSVGQRVNIYCVVTEYEHPKQTRGSDLICTMTISDTSYHSPGLRVLVFADALKALPRVKAIGDIIRFHRVTMQNFNGIPQAIAKVGKFSSFLLFGGKRDASDEPYQISSKSFTIEQYDHEILKFYREWIISHPIETGGVDYLVSIRGMKEGAFFDLCCKVLYVYDNVQDSEIFIYVWDGTDSRRADATPLHPSQVGDPYGEDLDPKNLPLSRISTDVLCDFPSKGTILPIVPDIPAEELRTQLPPVGTWVKFRNLTCRIRHGSCEGVFMRESKISLLEQKNKLVKEREIIYQQRVLSTEAGLPEWSPKPLQSLTVTNYEHVPLSTLREALCHPQVTQKFRSLVQVVAIWPSKVCDFCTPASTSEKSGTCPGNLCLKDDITDMQAEDAAQDAARLSQNSHYDGYTYRIQLTLEDPTARIQAYLYADDANKFFNGHPPADLHNDGVMAGALERKVHKLLGMPSIEAFSSVGKLNPPWIKCCLKSYYLDKQSPKTSRRFRIFGTTLPG